MRGMPARRRSLLLGALTVLAACGGAASGDARTVAPVTAAGTTGAASATTRPPVTTASAPIRTTATTVLAPIAPTTTPATTAPPTSAPPMAAPTTVAIVVPTPAPVPPPNVVEPIIEVGSIQIPSIGIDKTMFEGVTLPTLDHGPGHWPGTAAPGQVGNVVVAGHRVSHGKPFEDLDRLVPGDEVVFNDTTGRHVYHVTGIEIVGPDALWIVDQTTARTATLFACHPKGSTKQRIVAHLEYVETTA